MKAPRLNRLAMLVEQARGHAIEARVFARIHECAGSPKARAWWAKWRTRKARAEKVSAAYEAEVARN